MLEGCRVVSRELSGPAEDGAHLCSCGGDFLRDCVPQGHPGAGTLTSAISLGSRDRLSRVWKPQQDPAPGAE